jgi:hypothetical protein
MTPAPANVPYVDDSDLSEITILPDGRVYIFGLSKSMKELLETLQNDLKSHQNTPISYQNTLEIDTKQALHTP